jgi:beta-lactam-binding protein with PASTA domain
MAPRVSPDLENALAESPAARERFWALPPDRKDAWVAYVERGRFAAARRRRAADAVRRLGAPAPTVQEGAAAPVALPRTDWTEWVIGLALLLGLAAFLLWLTVFRHHHKDAKPTPKRAAAASTVPKVTGIAVESAKFQLQDAKLTSTVTRLDAPKPKGIVVAQVPKPGSAVPRGTSVALVVSNGPPRVATPDLVGLAKADAVQALQANGLKPKVQEVAAPQAPGTVVAQSPTTGKKLAKGATVRLKVSKGAPQTTTTAATTATATTTSTRTTTAPSTGNDYSGMRLRDAVRKIANGRQQVVVQYVTSSTPAGVVVSNANDGARVRLQVSLGAHPKPAKDVPDTTNEDVTAAQQDLTAAGFTVIEVGWPVSDAAMDAVVVYQTPLGRIAQGAAIVIYVGSSTGG